MSATHAIARGRWIYIYYEFGGLVFFDRTFENCGLGPRQAVERVTKLDKRGVQAWSQDTVVANAFY